MDWVYGTQQGHPWVSERNMGVLMGPWQSATCFLSGSPLWKFNHGHQFPLISVGFDGLWKTWKKWFNVNHKQWSCKLLLLQWITVQNESRELSGMKQIQSITLNQKSKQTRMSFVNSSYNTYLSFLNSTAFHPFSPSNQSWKQEKSN